jgi:hypothetical protein
VRVPRPAVVVSGIGRTLPLRIGQLAHYATFEAVEYDGDEAVITLDLVDSGLCWEHLDPNTDYDSGAYLDDELVDGVHWVSRLDDSTPSPSTQHAS